MERPRLLLISYVFPPAGGVAVQRALNLVKYLPRNDFDVHVLKAGNAAVAVSDPALLKQIPPEVTVHGALTPELPYHLRQRIWRLMGRGKPAVQAAAPIPGKRSLAQRIIERVLCPEPEVLWVPFALPKARAIIRRHRIDAVMVTVPPFSQFLVGNALKREFPHLTLIADFRDEWLEFYLSDFGFGKGEHTRRRAEQIERETVELSDLVVAVTPSTLARIRGRYPAQPDSKFACITNGYDPEAFAGFAPRTHSGAQTVVTYVGTVYTPCSPRVYLDTLDKLPDDIRSRIETRFIGRIAESERPYLENRRSAVREFGFLPHAEAWKSMEETDYLLLTESSPITLPGKLFEYLATRKPVLALAPPGSEVERLIRETQAGVCVDPADTGAVTRMIESAHRHVAAARRGPAGDASAIVEYERPRLVAEYARRIRERLAAR